MVYECIVEEGSWNGMIYALGHVGPSQFCFYYLIPGILFGFVWNELQFMASYPSHNLIKAFIQNFHRLNSVIRLGVICYLAGPFSK